MLAPSLQMGGIERAMSTLANYFVNKGYDVHFVTLLPLTPFFILDDRIHFYSPDLVFRRSGMSIVEYINFYFKLFSLNGYLRKTVKSIAPDTILDFCEGFPFVLFSLARLKIPIYSSKRTAPGFKPPFAIRTIRNLIFFFKKPDGVIMQTSTAMEQREWFWGNNIKIIPNPARNIINSDLKKKNWIVAVGRLHKEKGYDRLMKAFADINAPDWKLVIAGNGTHANYFHNLSKELKISEKVIFRGKVENVDELLSESKIFALTSYREGFPYALIEAMVAGLPCVAFDIIAGPRDIIQDGINGYLIKNGDIKSFSEKIQYIIDNPNESERLSVNAKKVKERYSIDKIGDMYLDFILQ